MFSTFCVVAPGWAAEMPTAGKLTNGNTNIIHVDLNRLLIDQKYSKTIIDWDTFNIGEDGWPEIEQPNLNAATMNQFINNFTSNKISRMVSLSMEQKLSSTTQQLNNLGMIIDELQEKFSYAISSTTMDLSIGFLGWILKTAVMLASILTILSVWTRFDPLPVLNISPEQRENLKIAQNKSREEEKLKYKSMATLLDKYDPLPNDDDLDNSI